jgi:CRP-like cAMP-binding protein
MISSRNVLKAREPNLQRFLDRLTKRSVLSEREQQAILDLPTRTSQAASNYDFVRSGDRVDHACLIVEGLVGRFDQNSQGARQITALHISGDMPDLHSVVQPTATSALQALSTTTILQVPHSALRSAAAAHPAIGEALWRDTMVDSMILAQWVVNVGRRDAKSRIAHLLCEMASRYGVPIRSGKVVFQLPMTQSHLGDATGLTPVHVNRTLMSLANEGVVFRHKTVRIDDWDRLVELGDFDSDYLQADLQPEERIRIIPQVN